MAVFSNSLLLSIAIVIGHFALGSMTLKTCEAKGGGFYTCPQSDQSSEFDICCGDDECCSSRLAGWAIAIIVVGVFMVFFVLAVVLCVCCACCPGYHRRRQVVRVSTVTSYTFSDSRRPSTTYQGMWPDNYGHGLTRVQGICHNCTRTGCKLISNNDCTCKYILNQSKVLPGLFSILYVNYQRNICIVHQHNYSVRPGGCYWSDHGYLMLQIKPILSDLLQSVGDARSPVILKPRPIHLAKMPKQSTLSQKLEKAMTLLIKRLKKCRRDHGCHWEGCAYC